MEKIKNFLFLNLNDYENIGITLPIGAILIVLSVCMIAFVFYYYFFLKISDHIQDESENK